jgi:hypothetical protein
MEDREGMNDAESPQILSPTVPQNPIDSLPPTEHNTSGGSTPMRRKVSAVCPNDVFEQLRLYVFTHRSTVQETVISAIKDKIGYKDPDDLVLEDL